MKDFVAFEIAIDSPFTTFLRVLLTPLCSLLITFANSCYFPGGLYCGGCALMVEKALGFHGDETLYVGDHIYTDVSMSKVHLRWRTALICRELEKEVNFLCVGLSDEKVIALKMMLMFVLEHKRCIVWSCKDMHPRFTI